MVGPVLCSTLNHWALGPGHNTGQGLVELERPAASASSGPDVGHRLAGQLGHCWEPVDDQGQLRVHHDRDLLCLPGLGRGDLGLYGSCTSLSAAAVYARIDAWHQLGTTVRDRAFTAEGAMQLGHLGGWNVRKVPLSATELTQAGVTTIPAPGFATVRTNPFTGQPDALGVVGSGYTPLQNEDHAAFLNSLADESGAIFETAGSLRGGRQVFVTMRLPETMRVGGVDEVDLNIAALNSHDGSSAFRVLVTPVRVVCANTQAAALGNHKASFSIRHTRNAKAAVALARDTLGLTFRYVEAFQAEAERLIETTMDDARFDALIADVFGSVSRTDATRTRRAHERRRTTLHHLFTDAETQAGIRGTAWAGYQAVAEYVDHFAPVRNTSTSTAVTRATRLLTSEEPTRVKHAAWKSLTPA